MKTRCVLLFSMLFLLNVSALARECKSCQEHRNGGSITYGSSYYAPGGIYRSGGTYYPGGVYPGYSGYRAGPNKRYNNGYGSGTISQTCGPGGCVTRYRGPASDIQYLPRINRQIRQSYPRSYNNPWNRPKAVPFK